MHNSWLLYAHSAQAQMMTSVTVALGMMTVGGKSNKNFPEDYAKEKGWIKEGSVGRNILE